MDSSNPSNMLFNLAIENRRAHNQHSANEPPAGQILWLQEQAEGLGACLLLPEFVSPEVKHDVLTATVRVGRGTYAHRPKALDRTL